MDRVAIIGAGVAGLTCAYSLKQAGRDVVVYEREQKAGGRMSTRTKNRLAFDTGANFLIRAYSQIHRLAEEFGVTTSNLSPVQHVVYRDGHFSPMNMESVSDLFRIQSLDVWTRMRFLAFAVRIRIQHPLLDFFDLTTTPDELNQEDAHAYACREVGPEFADYIVDAFNSCMMFSRANETSATAFLALFSMMIDPAFDFSVQHAAGDMQAIPQALSDAVSTRTNCVVESLERVPEGWLVTTAQDSQVYLRVVLATTAGAACKLMPVGPQSHLDVLSKTRYASTINVSFRVPCEALGPIHCFYVPFVESQIISEFTNESLKGGDTTFEGWSLVNVGLHETAAIRLMDASDEEIFETVRVELLQLSQDLAGISAHVHSYDLQRWPEAIPKYDCDHLSRVRKFLVDGQGQEGLYLCGDYLNAPWLEGASRSGLRAAESVLASLQLTV